MLNLENLLIVWVDLVRGDSSSIDGLSDILRLP